MNKNQFNADFAERLKLKVEAVPTIKGHESEPQPRSETVYNVCVVFVQFTTNNMVTLSENAAKGIKGILCQCICPQGN